MREKTSSRALHWHCDVTSIKQKLQLDWDLHTTPYRERGPDSDDFLCVSFQCHAKDYAHGYSMSRKVSTVPRK